MDTRTRPITTEDHRIATARGTLFARCWRPPTDVERAPVVLFHDSLGCVELWRDFPAQLCSQTGRQVVAYDRKGRKLSSQMVSIDRETPSLVYARVIDKTMYAAASKAMWVK